MKSRMLLSAAIMLGVVGYGVSNAISPGQPAKAMQLSGEWPSYGRDTTQQRYSPLTQINTETVGRLGLAWYHEFDTDRGQEATPLMVDGVLYVSTAWSKVFAFDAASGKLLWSYDPEVDRAMFQRVCCDAVNRGVALSQGRVFVGALDGRLIALDAKTGKPVWTVNTIKADNPAMRYSITGAPLIAKDKVLIGNGGADMSARGYVTAYDVATGKLAWRFYTVPNAKGEPDGAASDKILREKAVTTWSDGEWKRVGGGGTVWDSMAYDPESGLVFLGVGNGGPHDHDLRSGGKGDNLFLSSIVAVRPETGEYVWHYQTTPADSWDYTATQHLMLAELMINGQPRKVVMQAPKNGFFYVLDRMTGQLLSARNFVPVTWTSGVDMKTGRPIDDPKARYHTGTSVVEPAAVGAHSWHPMAFSPKTGLVYIPAQLIPQNFSKVEKFIYKPIGYNTGIDLKNFKFPDDKAIVAAALAATKSKLIAWDPVAQKARWSIDHQWYANGGILATAGDLVFQGTAEGKLIAYHANDGHQLWSYETTNGIMAPPISYEIKGRQYIAVMIGMGGAGGMLGRPIMPDQPRMAGRLMVFALDGKAKAAPYAIPEPLALELDGVTSNGDPQLGLGHYNENCMPCHGINASGRFTADLRRSPMLHTSETWRSVVIDGALAPLGMGSFARNITPEEAEDIRAYVIQRARILQSQQRQP